MKLTLMRTHVRGPATFGKLLIDGVFSCFVLEDEVREQLGVPVHVWKVPGATAIPSTAWAGRDYPVTLENSPRFGPGTLTINGVPGFSGVRMHAGNTVDDTEGCPLLGLAITPAGIRGGTSRPAVQAVQASVAAALARGETCALNIVHLTEAA